MNRTDPQKGRTPEKWKQKKQPYIIKQIFTPRLAKDLSQIPPPDPLPSFDIENGEGYFISGDVHTGKTVLASQILLEQVKQDWLAQVHDRSYVFVNTGDLFEEIKNTFSTTSAQREDEVKDKYREADILLLDDLGLGGKVSDWFLNTLYLIINHRYENLLPTIITSNLDLKELDKLFGDSRISSRIQRMCKIAKKKKFQN